MGHLRRRQRREPRRRPAIRHGARRRPDAPVRSSGGHPRPRRRPAPHRSRDDPPRARVRGRKAGGGVRRRDEPALRCRRRLLADRGDGGSSAPSRKPADRALPRRAGRTPGAPRRRRKPGSRRPGRRPALDRRAGQGPAGEPRQGADRGRGTPARRRSCRRLRPERVSGQQRHHGQLLRDQGRGAAEPGLAGRARRRHEVGHGPDAGRPRWQSRLRCPRRPRLRRGPGEGPPVDRPGALGRRNIRQDDLAHSPRPLPRIVGRRSRGRRHDERRPAADPPPVRWTDGDRSARADAGGQDRPGYEIVRETWTPILGAADFDTKWNRVLHDGFLSGSELPEVVPTLTAEPLAELGRLRAEGASASQAAPGSLEVVFLPSPPCTTAASPTTGGCRSFPIP